MPREARRVPFAYSADGKPSRARQRSLQPSCARSASALAVSSSPSMLKSSSRRGFSGRAAEPPRKASFLECPNMDSLDQEAPNHCCVTGGIRIAGSEKTPLDGLQKGLGGLVAKACRSSMMRGYSVETFSTATFGGWGTFATSPVFSDDAANISFQRRFRSTQPLCFRLLWDHFLMSNLLLENQFSFGSSSGRDCIGTQSFCARRKARTKVCAPSGHFVAGPRCVREITGFSSGNLRPTSVA